MSGQNKKETVVVVHGLAANRLVMYCLARRLRANGYNVVNWGYPSIRRCIECHAGELRQLLDKLDTDPDVARYHLVTHSMGGILARAALGAGRPQKLGRVVMLAPPHGGSHVAKFLAPWLQWLCRPLAELSCVADSYVNCLPRLADVEFGVIAAKVDVLVPEASTHLEGEVEHIVMSGLHTSLVFQRNVAQQVASFLRTGRFLKSQPARAQEPSYDPAMRAA